MDKLEELRELLTKATSSRVWGAKGFEVVEVSDPDERPESHLRWHVHANGVGSWPVARFYEDKDAHLWSGAVNALPDLLDEITRLNVEVERLQHKQIATDAQSETNRREAGDHAEAANRWRNEWGEAQALIDEMVEGLQEGAGWFEEYSRQHYAKARTAPDGREQHGREVKGKVNAERAKYLRALILKARGKDTNVG